MLSWVEHEYFLISLGPDMTNDHPTFWHLLLFFFYTRLVILIEREDCWEKAKMACSAVDRKKYTKEKWYVKATGKYCVFGTMTLDRNCCLLKAVLCPYPYPRSKSIFRGLPFYVINLRIFWTELKMIVVILDEVLFDEVSCTSLRKGNKYRIYSAIRRGFHLSKMTTNNLISSM